MVVIEHIEHQIHIIRSKKIAWILDYEIRLDQRLSKPHGAQDTEQIHLQNLHFRILRLVGSYWKFLIVGCYKT